MFLNEPTAFITVVLLLMIKGFRPLCLRLDRLLQTFMVCQRFIVLHGVVNKAVGLCNDLSH